MSTYILCPACGNTYDIEDEWAAEGHSNQHCSNTYYGGPCETCGGVASETLSHPSSPSETNHKDMRDCVLHLKEQVRDMESYRLEHDTRYCELEKGMKRMEEAVKALADGRRAALEESRTLKTLRKS